MRFPQKMLRYTSTCYNTAESSHSAQIPVCST